MFLNHFDLTAHPFAEKPPIDWLLRDERTDQALARLKFFEQQGAIALIIANRPGQILASQTLYRPAAPQSLPPGLSAPHTPECQRLLAVDRHQTRGKAPDG